MASQQNVLLATEGANAESVGDQKLALRKLISCRALKEIRPYLRNEDLFFATDYQLEHPEELGTLLDVAIFFYRFDIATRLLSIHGRAAGEKLVQASCRAVVWSARDGRESLLKSLLDYQGSVEQRDWHGRTALHAAVRRGHAEVVGTLLASKAWETEPEFEDVEHWMHHWHLLPVFDAAGVTLSRSPPAKGSQPARLRQQREILPGMEPTPARMTQDRNQLAKLNSDLRDRLLKAIHVEDLVEIESLVRRGVPLHAQYPSPRAEARKSQTGGGLPVSTVSDMSMTLGSPVRSVDLVNPVDWAALSLKFKAAVYLLEISNGKVVFGRDECGSYLTKQNLASGTRRALTVAAFRNELPLLRMLLDQGADVRQKSAHGESGLFLAVRQQHEKAVALLLRHGAWDAEEHKQELLKVARARGMLSVLDAAGILADGPVDPSEPIPPIDSMINALAAEVDDSDRLLKLDRFLELGEPKLRPMALRPSSHRPNSHHHRTATTPRSGPRELLALAAPPLEAAPLSDTPLEMVQTKVEHLREHAALRADLCTAIKKGDLARIQGLYHRGGQLSGSFDLGHGLDGNCVDLACVAGKPEAAQLLLRLGETMNLELARYTRAALFWCVIQGFTDILQMLLDGGVDLSSRCPFIDDPHAGSSALGLAVLSWRETEVGMLLNAGAWELETDEEKLEILDYVRMRKQIAIKFHASGIDINSSSIDAASQGTTLPVLAGASARRPALDINY